MIMVLMKPAFSIAEGDLKQSFRYVTKMFNLKGGVFLNEVIKIYNIKQAYFYIKEGLEPIGLPRFDSNKNKIYFVFDKEKSNPLYTKWIERSPKNKKRLI